MFPEAVIGAFSLLALIGFVLKELYERRRFKGHMDKIPTTFSIVVGRFAFYALYIEMAIIGWILLSQADPPLYSALNVHIPFLDMFDLIGMVLMALGLTVAFWSLTQID